MLSVSFQDDIVPRSLSAALEMAGWTALEPAILVASYGGASVKTPIWWLFSGSFLIENDRLDEVLLPPSVCDILPNRLIRWSEKFDFITALTVINPFIYSNPGELAQKIR
jgi:hypothetical protein